MQNVLVSTRVTRDWLTEAINQSEICPKDLGQCGSSGDDARIQAVDGTLKVIPADRIEVFTADREFASTRLITHLLKQRIRVAIRLECDALIEHNDIRAGGSAWLTAYQLKSTRGAIVYGARVNVCGRRMKVRPRGVRSI